MREKIIKEMISFHWWKNKRDKTVSTANAKNNDGMIHDSMFKTRFRFRK